MIISVSSGQSIQAAITAASPGATILVERGEFRENVVVPVGKDRLRLFGVAAGRTFLDGTGLTGDGFTVNATAVAIGGFTVRNFNDGIVVNTTDNVIRNNEIIRNGNYGLHLNGGRNVVVKNNVGHNGDRGVYVGSGTHNYIIDNRIWDNGDDGVHVDGEHTLVMENEVWGNAGSGLYLDRAGCMAINNAAWRNSGDGIRVRNDNVLVYGNASYRNTVYGLGFRGDHEGLVAVKNKFIQNEQAGIYAEDVLNESIFYKNELSYNKGDGFGIGGIVAIVNTSVLATNCVTDNREAGIDLDRGADNRILYNVVQRNYSSGIVVGDASTRNVVDDNIVECNRGSGIHLGDGTVANVVRSNLARDNRDFDLQADPPADVNNVFDLNRCNRSSLRGLCRPIAEVSHPPL